MPHKKLGEDTILYINEDCFSLAFASLDFWMNKMEICQINTLTVITDSKPC